MTRIDYPRHFIPIYPGEVFDLSYSNYSQSGRIPCFFILFITTLMGLYNTSIREKFPSLPIIATGGPTDESIIATIEAGANAITWTPPSNGEVFKDIMDKYRHGEPHPDF